MIYYVNIIAANLVFSGKGRQTHCKIRILLIDMSYSICVISCECRDFSVAPVVMK